tara:strand:+ start:749 stop:2023 length:1275 start_codon:yes stop_codon:yes gene_type:complete
MGLLQQTENIYYSNQNNSGSYQFISLDNIINNFVISYVGQDKLIPKARKSDVQFHAMRSVQELSFDTFKSIKSQELVVPPSLSLMLPQDYVNYTNISCVDSSGIQKTLHPTSKTSNPQKKGGLISNGNINDNADGFTFSNNTLTFTDVKDESGGAILATTSPVGTKITIPVNLTQGSDYTISFNVSNPDPHLTIPIVATGVVDVSLYGKKGYKVVKSIIMNAGIKTAQLNLNISDAKYVSTTDLQANSVVIEVTTEVEAIIDNIILIENRTSKKVISKSWSNYKSKTSKTNNNYNYEDDSTWTAEGRRYGIDPQYAQGNGTFFIDNNMLYFGSDLNGKTIVIKYISDGIATDEEMIVHKLAEEAVYKCIAYAMLSTRANIPEYVVQRYRKEKFAATRKAKLRLSNIKLEELTQILRGKSKQIKH